nr:unnamed protein product [Callosobruchus analis]
MGTSGHSLDTFNIADLTPEQQRILIEIRRRKTELLLEIQVGILSIIFTIHLQHLIASLFFFVNMRESHYLRKRVLKNIHTIMCSHLLHTLSCSILEYTNFYKPA